MGQQPVLRWGNELSLASVIEILNPPGFAIAVSDIATTTYQSLLSVSSSSSLQYCTTRNDIQ